MRLRKFAASALVAATTLSASPAAFAGGYGGGYGHSHKPSLLQIVLALPYCIVFGCHHKGHGKY